MITISGHSDDLIEIDGDIREEISCTNTGEDGALIACSNGVVLRIEYRTCWRLFPVTRTDLVEIVPCPEGDDDNHSDVATIRGDVEWVVCRDVFAKP